MRILLVAEGMERGGAETHVAALARGLRDAGDEVEVLSAGGREAERLLREGVGQICVPFCRTPVGAVKSILAMRRALTRGGYDVLHAHARYPAFLLRVAAFGRRTPIAVTAHARFRHGPILRRVCFWGDFTVAVSEDIRCDLLRFCRLPQDRVLVIPNGIDVHAFFPTRTEEESTDVHRFSPPRTEEKSTDAHAFSLPQAEEESIDARPLSSFSEKDAAPLKGGLCVGFASRMDADCSRGAELLCAIAPRLARRYPRLRITLAGGGGELEKIRALAQKANADVGHEVVRTVGWVEDIAAFWRAQEVCVAVSRAAMEGAATGCAVLLCGNEGYLGPLCKENAERALESNFCCRGEKNATAERLLGDLLPLLSDATLRARIAREGRAFVLARLSLDAMVEKTRALYRRLAAEKKTARPLRVSLSAKKAAFPHPSAFFGKKKKIFPHSPPFFSQKRRKAPHSASVSSKKEKDPHLASVFPKPKAENPHKPSFFSQKRRKPPHLLVGGYFGCGNLGDDAILLGLLQLLREQAPEIRVSVLSGDLRATRSLCRGKAYRRKSPLSLLRAFLSADAFLLGGGSLLQNRTGRLSLAYYLGLLRLSRLLKKPAALFAAGIGPLLGEADQRKTRLALSSLSHVGLRDPLSLSLLRSLGLSSSLLSLGSDPAFFIAPNCSTLDQNFTFFITPNCNTLDQKFASFISPNCNKPSNSAEFLSSSPTFTENTPKNKQLFPTLQKKERENTTPFPTVFSENPSPSGKEAEDCLPKNRIFPTCDANLQKRSNFSPTLKQKEWDFAENRLLLLLRECRDLPTLPEALSSAVGDFCRERGLSLLLLPMDVRADLAVAKRGAEVSGGRLLVLRDPRELLALLSASRACVTLRLHGAILSSSAGRPCLCISPDREDQKLAAFAGTLGQEHLSSTKASDAASLSSALSRLLARDGDFCRRLLLLVEEERKKARKDLAKLLEMLYNKRG